MRRRTKIALAAGMFTLTAYNALVYMHARALTHFTEEGARTLAPERLSTLAKLETLVTGVRVPKFRSRLTPASWGLAYETHHYPSKGAELEAWLIPHPSPRGTALIFHGYGAGKAAQIPIAKELHDQGWRTFLVDFRGSGGSSGFETTLGVLEADDVSASVAYVASLTGDGRPLLYGTSMGSAAILRAVARNHVEARGAILECPFGRILDTVKARFALMGVPSFPSAQLLVLWGGGLEGWAHDPVLYARSVRFPVLLLHGEDDPDVSVEQVREIETNLAGPKELVTFAGVAHESYLAKQLDDWRAAVSRFLARVQ